LQQQLEAALQQSEQLQQQLTEQQQQASEQLQNAEEVFCCFFALLCVVKQACHMSASRIPKLEKKRKEKTTLLSVIKQKLMVNLSFPLA